MSQGEVMDGRPTTEVERQRQRAMVIAQEIATGLDDQNVTGPQFLAFMKSCVTTDDISFMAEALLASAAAAQAMREALEKAAEQFEFYARAHRNKAAALPGTATTDSAYLSAHAKAATNEQKAAMCRAAIEKATKP